VDSPTIAASNDEKRVLREQGLMPADANQGPLIWQWGFASETTIYCREQLQTCHRYQA